MMKKKQDFKKTKFNQGTVVQLSFNPFPYFYMFSKLFDPDKTSVETFPNLQTSYCEITFKLRVK